MLMYGWMVFVEHAPERYDWAVKLMTGGRIDRIKDMIADTVRPGDRILDIGCGTGTLAFRCIKKGAHVTGIDISPFMIEEATRRAAELGYSDKMRVVKDSVTQIGKRFEPESFDLIVSTMALGEFPREYLRFVMLECRRLLRPGGKVIIADEVKPTNPLSQLFYFIAMVLLWIPQFLLLRRVFFPIADLRGVIEESGFTVTQLKKWPLSTFQIVYASRDAAKDEQAQPALLVPSASPVVP
jgi:demethylmenaquinone methyltransferase/2-methoxy-6-polyprenyl-1,4-benzoquinol methylase